MIREASAEDGSPLRWLKSSHSDSSNSNECVEVAATPGVVHVRDSKDIAGPRLAFTPETWTLFIPYGSEG